MPKYKVLVTKEKLMSKMIVVVADNRKQALETAKSRACFEEVFDEQGASSSIFKAEYAIEV
jgi:hypothetical protein